MLTLIAPVCIHASVMESTGEVRSTSMPSEEPSLISPALL